MKESNLIGNMSDEQEPTFVKDAPARMGFLSVTNFAGFLWVLPILLLIAYSMGIFFVISWEILYWLMVGHVALIGILGISPIKILRNLLILSPFIVLTGLLNWAFSNWESALLIMARITLLCNMTFIFSQAVPILKFAKGLSVLFFGRRDIAITVAVAVTFMPIILHEFRRIREGMNARARKRGLGIAIRIFGLRILYRASILSLTLEAKGYK